MLRGRIWGFSLVSTSQWEGAELVLLLLGAFPEVILGKGKISAGGWCCSGVEILLPNSEIPAANPSWRSKPQTGSWGLMERPFQGRILIGMDAFTNRYKYLLNNIWKDFKPHNLSFSGADSSAIVTLSESWACQENSGVRTKPLLGTLGTLLRAPEQEFILDRPKEIPSLLSIQPFLLRGMKYCRSHRTWGSTCQISWLVIYSI